MRGNPYDSIYPALEGLILQKVKNLWWGIIREMNNVVDTKVFPLLEGVNMGGIDSICDLGTVTRRMYTSFFQQTTEEELWKRI